MNPNDKHPLTSELTIVTPQGEKAHISNLPAPVMQALYNQITGRRERISNSFNKDYIIDLPTIKNLIEKIEQTLIQFNHYSTSSNFSIFHYKKDAIHLSSFEKFLQYDIGRNDKIASIAIEINFLISVPQVREYQNYKIKIDFNSYVNRKHDKKANYSFFGYRDIDPISYTIEYVDYVVARTFKQTIEEWAEGISTEKILKISDTIERNETKIQKLISNLSAASICIIIYRFNLLNSYNTTESTIITLTIFFMSKELIDSIVEECIDSIGARGKFPFIMINNGDKKNHAAFKRKREKTKKIYSFFLFTCTLPIIINIISSFMVK